MYVTRLKNIMKIGQPRKFYFTTVCRVNLVLVGRTLDWTCEIEVYNVFSGETKLCTCTGNATLNFLVCHFEIVLLCRLCV